jgi:hypothetical protein
MAVVYFGKEKLPVKDETKALMERIAKNRPAHVVPFVQVTPQSGTDPRPIWVNAAMITKVTDG